MHGAAFRAQQIANRDGAQDTIDCALEGPPKRADGAVGGVRAGSLAARMAAAEAVFVDAAAEDGQSIADANAFGGKRERIAARFTAYGGHKSALAQNAHQLTDVRLRNAFAAADFRNRNASARALARDLQQTAQSVFVV